MKAHLSSCFSSSQTVTTPRSWASGEPLAAQSCRTESRRLSRDWKASGRAKPGRDRSGRTRREGYGIYMYIQATRA